jgi:undecaprenyl diphosphate synthase
MMQSTSQALIPGPHVAIIMDGNGRWATRQGMPRLAGHRAGVGAVRRAVEAAPRLDIGTLTLFAFSADNWGRPEGEVKVLMQIFEDYLRNECEHLAADGIKVNVIGRRDRFSPSLRIAADRAESLTRGGTRLNLRIAIDYSGREAILEAARKYGHFAADGRQTFSRLLAESIGADASPLDIDLLIRTGGEQRLSDLPLWEIAYAELYFTPRMWPEFTAADLEAALADFHTRERRFGRLPVNPPAEMVLTGGRARAAHAALPNS